jgi:hypothetical protein
MFVFLILCNNDYIRIKQPIIFSNMKFIKSLSIIAVSFITAFVFMTSSCKTKSCSDASIVFNPSSTTATKAPGEQITFDIVVTGTDNNIKDITVTKSSNGVTDPAFITQTGIGSKGKTITLLDSVPLSVAYNSTIVYTVTATSDCSGGNAVTKTFTVTVGPSSDILDKLIYGYGNNQIPNLYSRYSVNPQHNSAFQLLLSPIDGSRFAGDPNDQKDIRDSIAAATPFAGNTRWGSRNGSKFVKAVGFNYATASAKSIIDAYNAGVPSDLVSFAANDCIIVNIKNQNKYAVVLIKAITDDGATSNEDYTFFCYTLAQK